MQSCNFEETHLVNILFDVLPRYTKLHYVTLASNNINSIKGLAERLTSENHGLISPSVRASRLMLHHLDLEGNPFMSSLTPEDLDKQDSMLTLLESFPMLYRLDFSLGMTIPPRIKSRLKINRINHAAGVVLSP